MPNNTSYIMPGKTTRSELLSSPNIIELWVKDYYGSLLRLTSSILHDPHEAEDSVQETFLAANRNLEKFRNQSSPRTWLTAIAINVCRGRLRKRRARQSLYNALEAFHLVKNTPQSPEETALQEESNSYLWDLVEKLDEKHRLPLILRYVQELSIAEIAIVLKVPQGTIHSRLHYARRWLQTHLKNQDE